MRRKYTFSLASMVYIRLEQCRGLGFKKLTKTQSTRKSFEILYFIIEYRNSK